MKAVYPFFFGLVVMAVAASSSGQTNGGSPSIAGLETQIRDTVSAKTSSSADNAAIRRLNDLKIQLISLLKEEMSQLAGDEANKALSGASKTAIETTAKSDQDEIDALNDSLGTWKVGLPGSGAVGPATPKKEANAPGSASNGSPNKGATSGCLYSDKLTASFVGGIEQSGLSSQIGNTNGFLNAFIQSPFYPVDSCRQIVPAIWGRIRLLSGPLPSTTNVVAAITNPSGTITSSNLSNVGQVVDYALGPLLRLHQWDQSDESAERMSLFFDVGATTPLSSSNIQYSLQAPLENSQQCFQLVARYPSLTNGDAPPGCKLVNPVTKEAIKTLSFSNVDRTDFLVRYSAGFRFTHFFPAKGDQASYAGSLDLSIGQDESITGGRLHGAVFRIEGLYPLPLGTSSYLYVFGSASMKLSGNMNTDPIVLATAQTPTLPLPTSVAVLPLMQPNRDFYRLGVGLNIDSIFCKLKGNCATSDKSTP